MYKAQSISIKWLSILASYQLDDVIGCDEISTGWFFKSEVTRLWFIEAGPANTLLKKCKNITGDQRKQFQLELAEKSKGKTKYNYCYTISVSLYSLEWFMKSVYKSLYKVNMYIAVHQHYYHGNLIKIRPFLLQYISEGCRTGAAVAVPIISPKNEFLLN